MNKNILYLVSGQKFTGISAHALTNLYHLEQQLSYRIHLASPCRIPWPLELTFRLKGLNHSYRGFHPFKVRQDIRLLAEYCSSNKIDLIHTYKWYDLVITTLMKKKHLPEVSHIHTLEKGGAEPLKRWQRISLKYPDGILVPGNPQNFSIDNASFFLPPFIHPDYWQSREKEPETPLNILIVSKLSKDRYWPVLFSALDNLQRNDIHLLIFGKGNYRDTLEKKLSGYSVSFSFEGHTHLTEAYKKADAGLLLGPGSDGFCRTLYEFYAQNIPVIAPNYGVYAQTVPEVQDEGIFNTPSKLQELIQTLNPDKLKSWQQSLKKWNKEYNPKKLGAEYQKFYDSFLNP